MKTSYSDLTIGVLALQGDFAKHIEQLTCIGTGQRLVKLPGDLDGLDGLILPGGESTTMSILMDKNGLREPLRTFAASHPVYGTCAGMILLANGIRDNQSGVVPLQLMDIDVLRNGYGRQLFSFQEEVKVNLPGFPDRIQATFIRAPRIVRYGPAITVLAWHRADPVLVQEGMFLASSFHNELGADTTVTRYFLDYFVADRH